MVQVIFKQTNISIEVPKGTTILDAARRAGVIIESPCNGSGTCGKCLVKLSDRSLVNVIQKAHAEHVTEVGQGFVLACQSEFDGDITVEDIPMSGRRNLKILDHGQSLAHEKNSFITKRYNEAPESTAVYADGELLGTERGNTERLNYGIVVDIGTTTLVVSLVDVNSGKELASSSALNPQAVHAQDVLSRIHFASDRTGLALMYTGLIQEINRMITEIAKRAAIKKNHIYEVVFSGNTCMLHLAMNINPVTLGKHPYTPVIYGGQSVKSLEHNLGISEFGLIYLPPIISSYVGADITSGILASKLSVKKGVTLFVDIGTNGEMVLAADGKLTATSTAAGPAFEGMNITHGMRAGLGAIESFEIKLDGFTIVTIGNSEAVGICGSGLLDIVGELVLHGVIDKKGRLKSSNATDLPQFLKERLVRQDEKQVFKLSDKVWISQKDIRQVQLAKGALRSGIEFLLSNVGISASEVDHVLIAGSFGYHLRVKSLIHLGLLPEEFSDKVEMVGNTSKSGGQSLLLNKSYRKKMLQVVKNVEVIELANFQDFDKVFMKCLGF
ncbi:MAG TPA: ferredoxin [Firmicutes bacterium]|jgi:uncharacterized 2Fe-2S/4Fe-4S cluster protein (DUF4445 family)|nr:ferredoxin [Bacillota bacterium]